MMLIESMKRSIPVKISLAIFIIEILLLAMMGIFYSARFSEEIDRRINEKLALPGTLMNQRAMTYDSVKDFQALSELVQEEVVEAFIFKRDGVVFFTADPAQEGRNYADFLSETEKKGFGSEVEHIRQVSFCRDEGHFISSISPLVSGGELLGGLYVRISADGIEKEKRDIVLFFCIGALLVVALTTLIEAYVVHRLIVPRIVDASTVLRRYALGDFSVRIDRLGDEDQLGGLMQQVNLLLERIEKYTLKLHALNKVGENFARATDRQEILRLASQTAEQHLAVRAMSRGEDSEEVLFSLPPSTEGAEGEDLVVSFTGIGDRGQLSPTEISFVAALSGLVTSALDRIASFARLTKAEEKYRYLFMQALEGIFRTSPEGRLLDANPALAAMNGYDSPEEMIASITHLADCYKNPEDRLRLMQLLEQEEKYHDFEVEMQRRDGSTFLAWMSGRAIKDRQGAIQSVEGRIVDISERKLREKEKQEQLANDAVTQAKLLMVEDLAEKNRQLQDTLDELRSTQLQLIQSEKMAAVGMTAGGVAHDLNNILAGVVSYPELLLATLPAESEVRKPLETILASGRRAAAVVADLLTLAQGSARVKQNVILDSLVEEYLQAVEFKQMMRDYPQVQVTSCYEAGNMCIVCSPVHIQKVIMNLVMNAVEAVSSSGGSVALRTRHESSDHQGEGLQDFVVLEVSDDGPGIPPESREHIFEPFYTRKVMGKKGTGLGLTVVWNVVREHEGRIEMDCDAPGTTFRVFLPAQKISASEQIGEVAEIDLQGQGRILVVDDEPLQRDVADKMLRVFGYQVDTVPSGEEAVAYLKEHKVDLVILDMLMPPGMNGLQTYQQISVLHPSQKALIVSGFSESADVKMAMQLGVGGFVKKPYTMQQIARAVKEELER